MTVTMETQRLNLRPFTTADAEAVQGYCARWEIAQMTARIPHPYPEGAAAAWIADHPAQRDKGVEYIFCLCLQQDPRPIGAAGLHFIAPGNFELGYWLASEHWGQGLASEATKAMVVYGFEKLDAEALNSGHFTDNPASGRVLEKAGFRANGVARQWSAARQAFVDANRLLLTRESWRQARQQAEETPS